MPSFDYTFTVKAPLAAVSAFHRDTSVLKRLTPPPLFGQIHAFEPLAEGSLATFTIWFGPFPLRWTAVHREVSQNGFTDVQLRGPHRAYAHTHRFTALGDHLTQVHEHVVYEHHGFHRGLVTRLLFNRLALTALFTVRKWLTRYHVGRTLTAAENHVPT
jgi:ligand-binding SRPBCC domain-containing protein